MEHQVEKYACDLDCEVQVPNVNVFSSIDTISEFLEKLKSLGDYADSHKCSSMLLQRIESYLVLHVICKEFVHENNAPIYTIHDSMLTALSNLGILRQKAEEVFGRYCYKLPSFHEEWYCDDCEMAA